MDVNEIMGMAVDELDTQILSGFDRALLLTILASQFSAAGMSMEVIKMFFDNMSIMFKSELTIEQADTKNESLSEFKDPILDSFSTKNPTTSINKDMEKRIDRISSVYAESVIGILKTMAAHGQK
jgi:hypothetical protein